MITGSLSDNILTLLVYNKKALPVLVNVVEPGIFESSIYQNIAQKAITFYKTYKNPIADHLPDEIESILVKRDDTTDLYLKVLSNLHQLQNSINVEFTLSQLQKFLRTQYLKVGIQQAVEFLENDDIESAESAVIKCRNQQAEIFNPGTSLENTSECLSFLTEEESNSFNIGISYLDKFNILPTRKELYGVMAFSGKGKSWFLIHIAKQIMLRRHKVLHVTLEMSEQRVWERVMRSLFAISKRKKEHIDITKLISDGTGRLMDIEKITIDDNILSLSDKNIKDTLLKKLNSLRQNDLRVKEFPTGQLTIKKLKAFLNNLQECSKFIPDVLIIDYADCMSLDRSNLRVEIGDIYKELRGLAVEYNIAVVTASQSNRFGADAKVLSAKNMSEDISKYFTADNFITYNQTSDEKELGLARLSILKGRNESDGQLLLISQNYDIGQFCLSSSLMSNEYKNLLKENLN